MYEFPQTQWGANEGSETHTSTSVCTTHTQTQPWPLNYNCTSRFPNTMQVHRALRTLFKRTRTQRRRACSTSAFRGPTSTPPARCRRKNKELSGSHYKEESHTANTHFSISVSTTLSFPLSPFCLFSSSGYMSSSVLLSLSIVSTPNVSPTHTHKIDKHTDMRHKPDGAETARPNKEQLANQIPALQTGHE